MNQQQQQQQQHNPSTLSQKERTQKLFEETEKVRIQFIQVLRNSKAILAKKKYKASYFALENFIQEFDSELLSLDNQMKLCHRMFYLLDKAFVSKLLRRDINNPRHLPILQTINNRMIQAFTKFNDNYNNITNEQAAQGVQPQESKEEDSIAKILVMVSSLLVNSSYIAQLSSDYNQSLSYLMTAKKLLAMAFTLNNSKLLEKDIIVSILLGNLYSQVDRPDKAIEIFQDSIKAATMYLRYKYAEPLQPIPGKIPTKFDEDKELLRQQRFQKAVKLVIQFLYGFAFAYEKAKKIESSYETLRLAAFLGKSVLFDDTDDFLKFISKLENELNTRYMKLAEEIGEIERITVDVLMRDKKWYEKIQLVRERKDEKAKELRNNFMNESLFNRLQEKERYAEMQLEDDEEIQDQESQKTDRSLKFQRQIKRVTRGFQSMQDITPFDPYQVLKRTNSEERSNNLEGKQMKVNDKNIQITQNIYQVLDSKKVVAENITVSQRVNSATIRKLPRSQTCNSLEKVVTLSEISSKISGADRSEITGDPDLYLAPSVASTVGTQRQVTKYSTKKQRKSSKGTSSSSRLVKSNSKHKITGSQGQNESQEENSSRRSDSWVFATPRKQQSPLKKQHQQQQQQQQQQQLQSSGNTILTQGNSISGSNIQNQNNSVPTVNLNNYILKFGLNSMHIKNYDKFNTNNSNSMSQLKFQESKLAGSVSQPSSKWVQLTSATQQSTNIIKPQNYKSNSNSTSSSMNLLHGLNKDSKASMNGQNSHHYRAFSWRDNKGDRIAMTDCNILEPTSNQSTIQTQSALDDKTEMAQPSNTKSSQRVHSQPSVQQQQSESVVSLDSFMSGFIHNALTKAFISKPFYKVLKDSSATQRREDDNKKDSQFELKLLKFKKKEDLAKPTLKIDYNTNTSESHAAVRQKVFMQADQQTQVQESNEKITKQLQARRAEWESRINNITSATKNNTSSASNTATHPKQLKLFTSNMSPLAHHTSSNPQLTLSPQRSVMFKQQFSTHNSFNDDDYDDAEDTFVKLPVFTRSLKEIIMKHRKTFPLPNIRKLLKDRKKQDIRRLQQQTFKQRVRQSLLFDSPDQFSPIKLRNLSSHSPRKLRAGNSFSSQSKQLDWEIGINRLNKEEYLKNKERIHDMLEEFETEREFELNRKKEKKIIMTDHSNNISTNLYQLPRQINKRKDNTCSNKSNNNNTETSSSGCQQQQQQQLLSSSGSSSTRGKKLGFIALNSELAQSTSLMSAMHAGAQSASASLLNVIKLHRVQKSREMIKAKLKQAEEEKLSKEIKI